MNAEYKSCRALPGSRLLQIAKNYFDQSTNELTLMPIIADIQHEYRETEHVALMRWFILFRGYWSFWKTIGLHGFSFKGVNMRFAKFIGLNVLALILCWLVSALILRVTQYGTLMPLTGAQSLGCFAGLAIALLIRARLSAYLIASFLAIAVSEFSIAAYYRHQADIGRIPSDIGRGGNQVVLCVALVGVALGAILARYGSKIGIGRRTSGESP